MTTETTTSAKLHQKSCVVFGATSAIAQAVASEHAKHGYALALVGFVVGVFFFVQAIELAGVLERIWDDYWI